MRKLWKQLAAMLLCLTGCSTPSQPGAITHWAAYYDDALPAEAFEKLDLVVFDRTHYPAFETLKGETIVLAYISIGEVHGDTADQKLLEEQKLILEHNKTWNSYVVDVTAATWRQLVLGKVDDAIAKGFDGVMLDTADSPLYYARTKAPERLNDVREALISLIKTMRAEHPTLKIMVNRGFVILPQLTEDIDYVLAESIHTNTNVSTGQFWLNPRNTYAEVAKQLHDLGALAPRLKIFTLDYWNMDDVNGLERIYAVQRKQGFIPYVTTPDLRTFTPEPVSRRRHR